MAICQEANNVIRRRAILDIATVTEQNMYLKPTAAIWILKTDSDSEHKTVKISGIKNNTMALNHSATL